MNCPSGPVISSNELLNRAFAHAASAAPQPTLRGSALPRGGTRLRVRSRGSMSRFWRVRVVMKALRRPRPGDLSFFSLSISASFCLKHLLRLSHCFHSLHVLIFRWKCHLSGRFQRGFREVFRGFASFSARFRGAWCRRRTASPSQSDPRWSGAPWPYPCPRSARRCAGARSGVSPPPS